MTITDEEAKRMIDTIEWVAQTVHQAYHDGGKFDNCTKNTCIAAKKVLDEWENKRV